MSQTKSRSAEALRAAGYVQLPRWWATQEQVEMIEWMVRKNLPDIARIKAATQGIDEVDAAWRKHNGEENE